VTCKNKVAEWNSVKREVPKKHGRKWMDLACSLHDLHPNSGTENLGLWRLEAARMISKYATGESKASCRCVARRSPSTSGKVGSFQRPGSSFQVARRV
jgi:hypothetical protein